MSRRIDHATTLTRQLDELRKRCSEGNCVNWKCDGTRHMNIKGERWGDGWNKDGEEN